ncbi:hypothetical protein GMORB2_6794 [Geosmithia morbida]|uniref:Uncharacterized protein n=1 Tax=Geosmithia morbida TaxID=1094350 RepID=A0A9P5D682_9HYPO|nr:uncharacterized protein GMORB2_6794 [Geosmithia morbida]KAF4123244.1 hypothetical protein GMORB2_6794 [Geosmithia morbida]
MSATFASSGKPTELATAPAAVSSRSASGRRQQSSMLNVLPESPVDGHFAHDSTDDDANLSPDQDAIEDQDAVEDQDDAQAVLQPAMSAAAIHLTSTHTPAAVKAAALDKSVKDYMFDTTGPDGDDADAEDTEPASRKLPGASSATAFDEVRRGQSTVQKSPQTTTPRSRPMSLGRLPSSGQTPSRPDLPSPWHVGPAARTFPLPKESTHSQRYSRLLPARGVLEAAFSPTRNRSRSAGQEALKRLQKALPSFSAPSHLLPSLPSSFFSSSPSSSPTTDKPSETAASTKRISSPLAPVSDVRQGSVTGGVGKSQSQINRPGPPKRSASIHSRHSGTAPAVRPPMLRRATSDESMLYHSLSRASSLNDSEKFSDVREMVNLRFQAVKESLPDVSNFKMKIHTPSFISMNSVPPHDGPDGPRSAGLDRESSSGFTKSGASDLDIALQELTGDVVVMGGFRGSVLRSAQPPHQQVWAPVKLGFNMRKVNLEVGLDDEDEERMEETIIPSGMLTNVGPIDISRKLIRKLQHCENARKGKLRVWNYGYDWRLSPAILSRKLREFLETLPSNQPGGITEPGARGALVIAHSLGGVITRHAVNQRPELFSGVLYAGTPIRCINILGPIRNGDVVLLNEKLLSARVNFSMRTSFVFLPEDGFCFIDKKTQESYPIDFFNPQEWMKYRLSPCMLPPLPPRNRPPLSPSSPSLSSFLPTALRSRAESWSEKRSSASIDGATAAAATAGHGHDGHAVAEAAAETAMGQNNANARPSSSSSAWAATPPSGLEQQRNLEYLTRTLAATRKFRQELEHREDHQEANAYPPFAVLYSKTTPTVYAAQVNGREGIPCADAYDDLVFRAGDGVVLAKESMLPEGYSVVKGGRVHTDRGHITMLGDMAAVGKALRALVRGRRKGIGVSGAAAVDGSRK